MHYKDMDRCGYFDGNPPYTIGYENVFAVGWLEKGYPFPKVTEDEAASPEWQAFVKKLERLVEARREYIHYSGWHDCTLCPNVKKAMQTKGSGQGQGFIPLEEQGWILAFPSMVVHYVKEHQYRPPQYLVDAVMGADRLGGEESMKAIKKCDETFWWFLRDQERATTGFRGPYNQILKKSCPDEEWESKLPWTKRWKRAAAKRSREERLKRPPEPPRLKPDDLRVKLEQFFLKTMVPTGAAPKRDIAHDDGPDTRPVRRNT